MRPSLRSDSDIRMVLDCQWLEIGRAVGWNCTNDGFARKAPCRQARHEAEALQLTASVEWK